MGGVAAVTEAGFGADWAAAGAGWLATKVEQARTASGSFARMRMERPFRRVKIAGRVFEGADSL
jgi:hypothetical protein